MKNWICTECFWSGDENDLHTKFGEADEQVCPNCGAFEECVPESDAVIMTDCEFNFPFSKFEISKMLNNGWVLSELTVPEFLKSLKNK